MRHPYQHLVTASLTRPNSRQVLVAACGSQICVHDLASENLLATWPVDESKTQEEEEASNSSTEIITSSIDLSDRPRKRRKLSAKQNKDEPATAITNMIISQDSRYIIASTGEDKCVHVLEVAADGQLNHLSQRRMTKRPCGIALTPKNDFILVGDKFGDVYALPLHFDESVDAAQVQATSNGGHVAPAPFKPSATNLTVHTERNLKALKNQMLQAQSKPAKTKEAMEFPHELLLGHVSMLTDIQSASVPSPKAENVDREYIITSDRDEHIRVSRGRPQAHIIENYCFGHSQFVSKLCLARSDILVSGGGDRDLFVWSWCDGKLLGTLPIQDAVQGLSGHQPFEVTNEMLEEQVSEDAQLEGPEKDQIAVTGIWAKQSRASSSITIYCICEAVPALFEFNFEVDLHQGVAQESINLTTHKLPGNPIDLTFLQGLIILSVDNVYEKGSVVQKRKSDTDDAQSSRLLSCRVGPDASFQPLHIGFDEGEELVTEAQFKKVKDLVYGVGNLRKHSNEDTEQ